MQSKPFQVYVTFGNDQGEDILTMNWDTEACNAVDLSLRPKQAVCASVIIKAKNGTFYQELFVAL